MSDLAGYAVAERLGRIGLLTASHATAPDGRAVVMLHGDGEIAEQALSQIAVAHARIDSPRVPKTVASGPGFVVLALTALATADRVLTRIPKGSVPYSEGIVVTLALAEALAAAHRADVILGAVGATNVFISRDGKVSIIGFGGHAAALSDSSFAHPTVVAGGPATKQADIYAALLFVRSLVSYAAGLPAPLAQVLSGGTIGGRFSQVMLHALTLSGHLDGERSLSSLQSFWRTIGVTPDEAALSRRLLSANVGRAVSNLTVGAGGVWFSLDDGTRIDLSAKRALRGLLVALVDAHAARRRLSVGDLVAAGWPGESLRGTSGPDRLYTALASLRAAGLRDVFERTPQGYGIHAEIAVDLKG